MTLEAEAAWAVAIGLSSGPLKQMVGEGILSVDLSLSRFIYSYTTPSSSPAILLHTVLNHTLHHHTLIYNALHHHTLIYHAL
eukprot:CAMPEP_0174694046 /NCGR_PEP_ID=MMETSP1094-20130205/677_1 /TAXON_ID=156173 /ORGANISM="Chrysochromulina brevifilum, Strain UTEX LB 985" /LENGTH=81 /DNA_ID=CAMNT_0015890153 /DNA_START=47 /DNA_END=290 /DNA_ORIENTATION=-